jgi:hypothetical protein
MLCTVLTENLLPKELTGPNMTALTISQSSKKKERVKLILELDF